MKFFSLLLALTLVLSPCAANAQLFSVNVGGNGDSNTMSGAALLGNDSTQWNNFFFDSEETLVNHAGIPTSVTLTTANFSSSVNSSSGDGIIVGGLAPALYTEYAIAQPYYQTDPPAATVDFANLNPYTTYQVVFYSRNQDGGNGRGFSVTGDIDASGHTTTDGLINQDASTFTSTPDTSSADLLNYEVNSLYYGNYITTDFETDALGNLDLSISKISGGELDIAGLQITEAPEPSIYFLMIPGVAFLGFCARRRLA